MTIGTGKTQVSIEEYQKHLAQRIHESVMNSVSAIPTVKDPSKAIGEPLTEERLKELEGTESPLMRHINRIMELRYGKGIL